jgi:hypothetical protein
MAVFGRKTKYVIVYQSDEAYLLSVCFTLELGHTPAILWGGLISIGALAGIGTGCRPADQGIMSSLSPVFMRLLVEEA